MWLSPFILFSVVIFFRVLRFVLVVVIFFHSSFVLVVVLFFHSSSLFSLLFSSFILHLCSRLLPDLHLLLLLILTIVGIIFNCLGQMLVSNATRPVASASWSAAVGIPSLPELLFQLSLGTCGVVEEQVVRRVGASVMKRRGGWGERGINLDWIEVKEVRPPKRAAQFYYFTLRIYLMFWVPSPRLSPDHLPCRHGDQDKVAALLSLLTNNFSLLSFPNFLC